MFTDHKTILLLCSEMWHGSRWLTDPMYQAPMVETSVCQVFVNDFVRATDQHLGVFHGNVQRFYMKVQLLQ